MEKAGGEKGGIAPKNKLNENKLAEKEPDRKLLRQSTIEKSLERMQKEKNAEKDNKKKVTFEEEKVEWLEYMKSEWAKVKKERAEMEKWKGTWVKREQDLEEWKAGMVKKIKELEEKIEVLETKEKEREMEALLPTEGGESSGEDGSTEERTTEGDAEWPDWSLARGSRRTASRASSRTSKASVKSRRSGGSTWSLTEEETARMKKMMRESERKDRERNIVIKGESNVRDNLQEWVKEFMKDRLGLDVNIVSAWKGGSVIVVKLESLDDKRKIMQNKSKLLGTRIYIENDLSYEDRKKQEEINRWVKTRKAEGKLIKIGLGKINYEKRWIKWEDKEALKKIEELENKEEGERGELKNQGKGKREDKEEEKRRRGGENKE